MQSIAAFHEQLLASFKVTPLTDPLTRSLTHSLTHSLTLCVQRDSNIPVSLLKLADFLKLYAKVTH